MSGCLRANARRWDSCAEEMYHNPFVDHDEHIYLQPTIHPRGFAISGLSTC